MSEWDRSTRELPLEALAPDLLTAVQNRIDQVNLGPTLKLDEQPIETTSVNEEEPHPGCGDRHPGASTVGLGHPG